MIPNLYTKPPDFLRRYLSSVLHCSGNVRGQVPIYCIMYVSNDSARAMRIRGGGGWGHVGGKNNSVYVRTKLLQREIYCESQSGS